MHCFGYGYNLNTKLLYEIATAGNGGFYYVPDQSMVGTCFVNFVANSMCLYQNNVTVGGVQLQSIYTNKPRYFVTKSADYFKPEQ